MFKKINNCILAVLFLAVLALPLLFTRWESGGVSEAENRNLAQFPPLVVEGSFNLSFTKDFETWYAGKYNPILMPSNEDKIISPRVHDVDDAMKARIATAYNINNSDIDMCDWNGKVYINYLVGNQLGYYWMCEAESEGTVAEFLKSYFE